MENTYAAVDLGSNSFHLLVVREVDGQVHVVDKMRERVRLAKALNEEAMIVGPGRARALNCLELFAQRLSGVPATNIRIVGTNTLRKASSEDSFLAEAQQILGHSVDVVSGAEEARLVYRGVSHELPTTGDHRLVVDIGGGSTECIIGRDEEIVCTDSLYMGCVDFSERFFSDGRLSPENFAEAVIAARLQLGSIHRRYKEIGWSDAYGSSGTINAVQNVLTQMGHDEHCITWDGLNALVEAMVKAKEIDRLNIPGLKPDRLPVIAGGVAVLQAVFRSLRIRKMRASPAALREGVIYELLGRSQDTDIREVTVRHMADRFVNDKRQAERVTALAHDFLEQSKSKWRLARVASMRLLRWAADLHEIGKAISYAGYQRHGAYLVENSDMPGFHRGEQQLLAALILGQRRKLVRARFEPLLGFWGTDALRLIVIFRLASRLNRTRSPNPRPQVGFEVDGNEIRLQFEADWLTERPLTIADLAAEKDHLQQIGFNLSWSTVAPEVR